MLCTAPSRSIVRCASRLAGSVAKSRACLPSRHPATQSDAQIHSSGMLAARLSWSGFLEVHRDGRFEAMEREPRITELYRAHRRQVLQRYASMGDFIKVEKLGYQTATAQLADGSAKLVATRLPPGSPDPLVAFMPNEFPYWFEAGIQHDLLWSTHQLPDAQVGAVVAGHLPDREFLWFVNPEVRKSVPEVWHVHVISRRRRQQPADAEE